MTQAPAALPAAGSLAGTMRFTVRPGSDPFARADATLLAAMGLPGGGTVKVGRSHVVIHPGEVPQPTAILLGPLTMANAAVGAGDVVEVKRAMVPQAQRVILDCEELPADPQALARALQGRAVTPGDRVEFDPAYAGESDDPPLRLAVLEVSPGPAGLVGSSTMLGAKNDPRETARPAVAAGGEPAAPARTAPTQAEALLAGLDTELEMLTGWLALLTSPRDLPKAWGLPSVAGVLMEGPAGCGKSELVAAAAAGAGAAVKEVPLGLVFKPERLIDVLDAALKTTPTPGVIFADRLEAVAGEEGMFRAQVGAILRWFLDAVAEKPRLACVLGVSSLGALDRSITSSPLVPRHLSIPPPDAERRRLLFEAALARVPLSEIDYELLAARTAGFSGADILAAVVHSSALVAHTGGEVTQALLLRAIEETVPSLGTVQLGEVPSYGFERVANLDDVKQRLTEAVIWPMTDPERFARLGIDPPRGLLLYGPPGTGKTYVIRALAHESGAAFFAVKGAELLDKFVGESERGVREVFARARAAAPAILFFDELDALAPVRGRSTTSVTDSVVAALLTEMDGVADRGDIVIIGATNRRDLIDPALQRAGRFEVHIELGLPEVSGRRALLGITDVPFAEDVDLDDVAEATEGLSFADLTGALREAALNALRRDPKAIEVTRADLDAALQRYRGNAESLS